ncbi:putative membrane protein [Castellaniella defragrans 65Phen]|uniref:Putative membrane protein n=1 Tax=Castellaniella defragrans (strain DSM 12143 / CCUG 39792 / 65Phen) TaxID=1437824 RepID=W8X5U3_CASD6|nr:DUF4105 domain-containing protein [Castellaniella defragrans]CDM25927.1 putative membrane protein [Castellaniella defragrans 65Phen]
MVRWTLAAFALAFIAGAFWWLSLQPSNDRDWADEVSRPLRGSIQGSVATLHDIRDFDWRSDTDYTARWHDGVYDLDELASVDMALSYWMGPAIAHTLVSFGFMDGRHVVFSVEIRRERGEAFSTVGGFLKQFELAIVAAEERDILHVRAGPRGEQVFLYPIRMPVPAMRALFRSYVARANRLADEPRFYHTLTANCTTLVYDMVRPLVPGLPLDIRLILSGYLPEYLYRHGGLDTSQPLEVLRARADITRRAARPGTAAEFSRRIRAPEPAGGPAPPPPPPPPS